MNFNITAYSTALFSTWINVEQLNLLFDAGDGLSSGLLQKARKVKHVFISHADRDHLNGLPQFVQLNAREGFPKIYYPCDSGSFPAYENFLVKFDPHVAGSEWRGIASGDSINIKSDVVVEATRNEHVPCEQGVQKSLSYKVFEVKKKLKKEFRALSGQEIKSLVDQHGREFISDEIRKNIISFSGDTPVDDYSTWDSSEILIHEATFLKDEGDAKIEARNNKHSKLNEVLEMVSEITVGTLILSHFSSRYSREEIDLATQEGLRKYGIKIPVHLVYPGELKRDVLNSEPINA